jgi:hypothetical protein
MPSGSLPLCRAKWRRPLASNDMGDMRAGASALQARIGLAALPAGSRSTASA